jgi:initiation factor 1A
MPRDKSFVIREDGQHYGRVIRNLGHMNLLVYCNDNKQRICKIRGAIRNRVWMKVGDIVLVSYREFEIGVATRSGEEKGDVLHKYDSTDYGKLRKDPTLNLALFTNIETQDLSKITIARAAAGGNEDGYVFEAEDNEVVEGDEKGGATGGDWFEDEDDGGAASGAGVKVVPKIVTKVGGIKKPIVEMGGDDIDIDNI